jgi:hypothetical protein
MTMNKSISLLAVLTMPLLAQIANAQQNNSPEAFEITLYVCFRSASVKLAFVSL